MRHLLSVDDLQATDVEIILQNASRIHPNVKNFGLNLSGKILATLFFEPSTRTKLSFKTAMYKLGGQVIDLPSNSSQEKGESEADTIKTISQYVNAIVIRHPQEGIMEELVKHSDVPMINAGDGAGEHPTQALLDLYTIRQYKPNKDHLTIMFTGDIYYSRTIKSLLKLMTKVGHNNLKLYFTNKINWDSYNLQPRGVVYNIIEESEIDKYIEEVDVLYMTRPQKERWGSNPSQASFILTKDLLYKMKADAIIMHPLPRNEELPGEIDENYRAKYFQQAKNGLYVRMALLRHML